MKRQMKKYLLIIILLLVPFFIFGKSIDTVAVIPFDDNIISKEEATAYSDILENRLAMLGKFNLVERKAIEKLMEELNFSASDFVDQETAAKAGKLLSAQWLIMGSISKLGKEYSMNVKLVNTETGRIVTAAYGESRTISGLKDDVENIAKKLSQYLLSPFNVGLEVSAVALTYDTEIQSLGAKGNLIIKCNQSFFLGVYGIALRKNDDGELGFSIGGKIVLGDPRKLALGLSIGGLSSVGIYFKNISIDYYPTMLQGVENSFGVSIGYLLEF